MTQQQEKTLVFGRSGFFSQRVLAARGTAGIEVGQEVGMVKRLILEDALLKNAPPIPLVKRTKHNRRREPEETLTVAPFRAGDR